MRKGIVSSVFLVTVFSVLTRLLAFIFKVYISRRLGAEVVGIYQTALQIFFMVLAFSSSGIQVVLSRYIAKDNAIKSSYASSHVTSALIISLISAGISILFSIALYPLFSAILVDKRSVLAFYIILPIVISSAVSNPLRSWFWGCKMYLQFSTIELLEEIMHIVVTIIFICGIIAIDSVVGLSIGFLISDFICATIVIILFVKNNGRINKPHDLKAMLTSSAPLTLTRLFSGLTSVATAFIIPYMLIKTGFTNSEAMSMYGEVYGMAMPILMAPMTLISSLSIVLIPEIATCKTEDNSNKIENSIIFTLSICALFTILFMPFGEEISIIVFSDSFSGIFLSYSSLLLYPIGINQVSTSVLNSMGYEKNTFLHFVLGSVLMLITLIVLPQFIGIFAVTVGMFLSLFTSSTLNLRLLNKKIDIFNNMKKPILAIILSIPEILMSYLLKNCLSTIPKIPMVIISGGIPMILYLISLISFDILPKVIVLRHLKRKSS